jgi:hypothetical protein
MEESQDKFRVVTIALIFSGALNIGLVMALIFSSLVDTAVPEPLAKAAWSTPAEIANRQLLSGMLKLSFSELIATLTNKEPVEDGYTKRDLALSALTVSHFFNLEKALSSSPIQRRAVALSPEQTVELYPGLTDEEFQAVIRYAYQEKWPLTSKGLFLSLKKWPKNGREPSLCEAFFATPEFYALQALFQKTEAPQDPHFLLDLSLDGSWDILDHFASEQRKSLDLSLDKRRALLLSYLTVKAPTAAALLLKSDFQFAKTRMVDEGVLMIIDLLREKSPEAERYCIDLLHSPRTDAVCKAAAEKLYAFAGERVPLPFDRETAIARFAAPASSNPAPLVAKAPPPKAAALPVGFCREHTVQDGDTLWKIARQYKVTVEELVQMNGLEKDRLHPGMVLRVP